MKAEMAGRRERVSRYSRKTMGLDVTALAVWPRSREGPSGHQGQGVDPAGYLLTRVLGERVEISCGVTERLGPCLQGRDGASPGAELTKNETVVVICVGNLSLRRGGLFRRGSLI